MRLRSDGRERMSSKTLYLETTTVPAQKTIGEITALLVRGGIERFTAEEED
jgi:hypothetical protein